MIIWKSPFLLIKKKNYEFITLVQWSISVFLKSESLFLFFIRNFNIKHYFRFCFYSVVGSGTGGGIAGTGTSAITGSGRGPPVSPAVSNRQPFPRNVPSRSTFHSGQNRQRNHTGAYGPSSPLQSQDTSAITGHGGRTSFFSKLSSKFSKR